LLRRSLKKRPNLHIKRHFLERFINKIKHFRRVFQDFEKLGDRCMPFLYFVGTLIWLW